MASDQTLTQRAEQWIQLAMSAELRSLLLNLVAEIARLQQALTAVTRELEAIDKVVGFPYDWDGLPLVERVTLLKVQLQHDNERCKVWADEAEMSYKRAEAAEQARDRMQTHLETLLGCPVSDDGTSVFMDGVGEWPLDEYVRRSQASAEQALIAMMPVDRSSWVSDEDMLRPFLEGMLAARVEYGLECRQKIIAMYGTERTLACAWRKRAEEAEQALIAAQEERDQLARAISAQGLTDLRSLVSLATAHREDSERVDAYEAERQAAEEEIARLRAQGGDPVDGPPSRS